MARSEIRGQKPISVNPSSLHATTSLPGIIRFLRSILFGRRIREYKPVLVRQTSLFLLTGVGCSRSLYPTPPSSHTAMLPVI